MARRKVTPDEQRKWFELYNGGMSTTDIAKEVDRPARTVRENVQKLLKENPDVKRASKPKPKAGPKKKKKTFYKGTRQVVFLPEETHRLLKMAAAIRGTGASEIVNEALQKHLKDLAKTMPLVFGEKV